MTPIGDQEMKLDFFSHLFFFTKKTYIGKINLICLKEKKITLAYIKSNLLIKSINKEFTFPTSYNRPRECPVIFKVYQNILLEIHYLTFH